MPDQIQHTEYTVDGRLVTISPYQVSEDHWEYRCKWGVGKAFLFDSIECDNGVPSQRSKNSEEALERGQYLVTTSTFVGLFGETGGSRK